MNASLRPLVALVCGLLFGFGLALSGMLDPTRVRGFLDIFGAWDPSLAFVLAGAVITSFVGVRLIRRRAQPVLASAFEIPTNTTIDAPLVGGALLFGIGWGLAGFCPGPAIASLSLGLAPTFVFVAAMICGMGIFEIVSARRDGASPRKSAPGAAEQGRA